MEVERLDQSCTFQILKLKTKIGSKCCELFPNCLKQRRLQYWLTFCLTICCNQPQVRDRWQMVYLWLVAPIIAKKNIGPMTRFFLYKWKIQNCTSLLAPMHNISNKIVSKVLGIIFHYKKSLKGGCTIFDVDHMSVVLNFKHESR